MNQPPPSARFINENSRFGKHTPPVWREANGSIREPIPPLLTFRHVIHHLEEQEEVGAAYEVKDGPCFTARRRISLWQRRTSDRSAFEAAGEALLDIRDQVRAYNAAILPIDNGPDDEVAWSEALTRLAIARYYFYKDRREGGFIDDFDAALLAVSPYIHPTSTTPERT